MKPFWVKFIAAWVALVVSNMGWAASPNCDKPESPEKTRIYFVNGMNNTASDIKLSFFALENLVGTSTNRSFGISINNKDPFSRNWWMFTSRKKVKQASSGSACKI